MRVVINWFDKERQIQKSMQKTVGEHYAFNAAKKAISKTKWGGYTVHIGDRISHNCFRFTATSPDGKNSIHIYAYTN